MALWAAGSTAFFIWYARCSLRYFIAFRKSLGRDPEPSLAEVFDTYFAELWPAQFKRQADPEMESMRRRMWLAFALWIGHVILSYRVWAAVAGWMSL
jgi:hypothetical protein